MDAGAFDAATRVAVFGYGRESYALPAAIVLLVLIIVIFWRRRALEQTHGRNRIRFLAALAVICEAATVLSYIWQWQWQLPPRPLLLADRERIWCDYGPAAEAVAWQDVEQFSVEYVMKGQLRPRRGGWEEVRMTVKPAVRSRYRDGKIRQTGLVQCKIYLYRLQPEDAGRLMRQWRLAQQETVNN